jgi:hypothetical protein
MIIIKDKDGNELEKFSSEAELYARWTFRYEALKKKRTRDVNKSFRNGYISGLATFICLLIVILMIAQ